MGYDQFRKGRSIDDYLKCIDILMEHAKFELPRHDRHDDDKIAVSFGIPTFEYVSIFFRTDMHNCLSSMKVSSMSSFDSNLENNSEDVPLLKDVLQQAVDLD